MQSQLLLCTAWLPVMSQHSSFGATATSAFRAASAAGVRDNLCPQLLSLTFAALSIFAPAAESRVLHGGAMCEAPAEDSGPCSHHYVSEAQAKPTLTASLQPWVEGWMLERSPLLLLLQQPDLWASWHNCTASLVRSICQFPTTALGWEAPGAGREQLAHPPPGLALHFQSGSPWCKADQGNA